MTITAATHPAGRETDAAVARAMGWTTQHMVAGVQYWLRPNCSVPEPLPDFTSDEYDGWAAMREMVAWLRDKTGDASLFSFPSYCRAICGWPILRAGTIISEATTLPHAVALLVLMVAEAEKEAARE